MEIRERNNFYAVPFIGGILCIILLFHPVFLSMFSYGLIIGMFAFIFVLPDIICGSIMIYSAINMKSGKTTWIEEKKKLLISSWLAVSITLGFGIFSFLIIGFFGIIFEYGFTGGLITILGIYYYEHITKRNFIPGPTLVQEREKFEPSPMKEEVFFANPKVCTDCEFNLEGGPFKFCPNCGSQMTSE